MSFARGASSVAKRKLERGSQNKGDGGGGCFRRGVSGVSDVCGGWGESVVVGDGGGDGDGGVGNSDGEGAAADEGVDGVHAGDASDGGDGGDDGDDDDENESTPVRLALKKIKERREVLA